MTKIEIVNKIGESVALPKSDIEKILDQFVKVAQDTLKSGEKVSLTGLGSFIPKDTARPGPPGILRPASRSMFQPRK